MKGIRSLVIELTQVSVAVLLASIGLKAFLLPNNFLDGGVTGVSILMTELTGIELSVWLPILSVPFVVLGWFTVSRRILWKSILAIIALSLVIHFENFSPITEDKLLISIFGGLFLGAGIGLAIKNGAVLDGAEILGIFINEKTGISIGVVILWFNVILFVLTGVLFSLEIAMYSILAFLVTAKTIDLILEGFEDCAGLMIVSSKSEDLQEALDKKGGQGLTVYGGVSGIGRFGKKEDLQVIHTIINRIDLKKVYRIIEEIDADAFIIEFDVNNVKGGVLRKYFSKDKLAQQASKIVELKPTNKSGDAT